MSFEDKNLPHTGEYLLIDPPQQLSFTWISQATGEKPSVVTVDFLEVPAGTELVLTHRNLPPSQLEGHHGGWAAILGRLQTLEL